MGTPEVMARSQPDDNAKSSSSGSHAENPDTFWLSSSSSRTSGDPSEECDKLFDQFIVVNDNESNLAFPGVEVSSASSAEDEATLTQLLLEDMEKYSSTEAATSSDIDPFLESLKPEPPMLTAAVPPLVVQRQRPRQNTEQSPGRGAADPFTPGRHSRQVAMESSISYAELLNIEGLSMHSPGVPMPAALSVPRRAPASPQTPTPSPQKGASRRLEGIYSSLRRVTHSIRHAHESPSKLHNHKQEQRHRQRSMTQAQSGSHIVGSVTDVNLASGFEDDDPFFDHGAQDTPLTTPHLAYHPPEIGLAPAAEIGGVSTARFPQTHSPFACTPSPAHDPSALASFYLPEPQLLEPHGLPLPDGNLMIREPQPLPGNPCSTILAHGHSYTHTPIPSVPTTILPIHTHTRRPGPKAPSSGARYARHPSQAALTSPRKRSSGSGGGPSGGTSPSPTPRTQRKGGAAMRRSRSGSFGAAHHSAAGRGEVRKRRSCGGLGRAASGSGAVGSSTPRSASGSSFSSASEFGGGGGFVNFTMEDSQLLMTGVAPSGSSKTKARREREVADRTKRLSEVFRAMGGDVERLKAEGFVI